MENYPYYLPGAENQFPLIGLLAAPYDKELTTDSLDDMHQCGFYAGTVNLDYNQKVTQFKNLEHDMKVASNEISEYYGFKLVPESGIFCNKVDDSAIEINRVTQTANIVNTFKTYSELGAWYFCDEPRHENLEYIKKRYDNFKKLDPDHMALIVLAASESEVILGKMDSILDKDPDDKIHDDLIGGNGKVTIYDGIPAVENYSEYLDLIQYLFKPAVWIYDLYPFTIKNGVIATDHDRFFKYLSLFSKKSKETSRPFWTFLMTTPHVSCIYEKTKDKDEDGNPISKYLGYNESPTPTRGMLLFEAFGAIAYGAKGLMYYTYGQKGNLTSADKPENVVSTGNISPEDYDKYSEIYLSAPVNYKNELTDIWDIVKDVNATISRYSYPFVTHSLEQVVHVGRSYADIPVYYGPFGCLKASVSTGSAGVIMSLFSKENSRYLLIVNQDALNKQTISFEYDSKYVPFEVTPGEQIVPPVIDNPNPPVSDGRITRVMEPGGFIIIRYYV